MSTPKEKFIITLSVKKKNVDMMNEIFSDKKIRNEKEKYDINNRTYNTDGHMNPSRIYLYSIKRINEFVRNEGKYINKTLLKEEYPIKRNYGVPLDSRVIHKIEEAIRIPA